MRSQAIQLRLTLFECGDYENSRASGFAGTPYTGIEAKTMQDNANSTLFDTLTAQQSDALQAFAEGLSVTAAAARAGVHRSTVQDRRAHV